MRALAIVPLLLSALPAYAQHEGHSQAQMQDHSQHRMEVQPASPGAMPASPLPEPTAEERAAAFPDLGGMDMSTHMQENP
ncbi:MAG: hypothetical protein ACREO0_10635, partial [Pseudoxanthomonas sp.]